VSAFVDGERSRFGVEPICEALDVSASAYYQRASGRRSARAVEDERLLARIRELHQANYYAYGYRRMWKALHRVGEQVPRCRVQRLMRSNGIVGAKRRGKPWRTTKPDPQALRRPDLVQRDFSASRPNRLWVADLSYLRCWEGLVYFAFVIDAFSRMVVGWQLAMHMRTDLVLDALKMALGLRGGGADVELVHHSDRGSQYTSIDYTQTLDDHGVLASVGSVGDAYDNALAESFVDSFKTELIADRVWRTRPQLELAVVEYVGWFNNARLHESLGDIPPAEYEQRWRALTAATGANPDGQSVTAIPARAAERLTTPRLLAVGAGMLANGADHHPPTPIASAVNVPSASENARLAGGPAALSLRSPSGLAQREGPGEHDHEGGTTLTTTSARPK
jgi:putative transposase